MKYRSLYVLPILMLCSSSVLALLPMSDAEIRKMLVEGELNKFERGECPSEFMQRIESPENVSSQKGTTQGTQSSSESKTREHGEVGSLYGSDTTMFGTQQYNYGYGSGYGSYSSGESQSGSQSGSTAESRSKTINPAQCVCPCPFSRDLQGKSCGSNSAYVRTNGANICYPDDIPDWVIDEYRIQHDIPRK